MQVILSLIMILGGCQGDGRIDLQDLPDVLPCVAGPGLSLNDPSCECADLDGDGDSDLFDLSLFQLRFGEEYPCGRVSGSCLASHVTPGCGEAACCTDVCAADPFCCYGTWDAVCVNTAVTVCGIPPVLSNDRCQTPRAVSDGITAFTNVGATTDGPIECIRFPRPGIEIYADIWFTYTATCTGLAIVSLCGSEYDTTLAVYNGSACPTQPRAIQCSDDDCRDLESRTIVPVVQGQTYLVRVGGYEEETGTGVLSIRCTVDGSNDDACRPGGGNCGMTHRTPGCADVEHCEEICYENPACCDVTWDSRCSGTALLCCVYGVRAGPYPPRYRCTEGTECPPYGRFYRLRDHFPVQSCEECPD